MAEERLHRLSRVKGGDMDSLERAKRIHRGERSRAMDVLMEAKRHWDGMRKFRDDSERNHRYCFGEQWKDIIVVDGQRMTEENYIRQQGQVPLKNNLIRRLVRSVLGAYRGQDKEPTCKARDRDEQRLGEALSIVLQYNMQLNRSNGLVMARSFEEYLISGLVVHRKWYGWNSNLSRADCWTSYVAPNNFFVDNNMRDFRGWDVGIIGEIHDIEFGELLTQFAKSAEDHKRLSDIYHNCRDRRSLVWYFNEFGFQHADREDFLYTEDPSRCRVIEVWRKEQKPRYRCHDYNTGEIFKVDIADYDALVGSVNKNRLRLAAQAGIPTEEVPLIEAEWFIDSYWYYYFLSPMGDILDEGETPYEHKSHPYVFTAYPYINGEIHSFVSDVIDQQRYVNRLITMYDWIMRASAKGVLLVPEDCLGDHNISEIADEWSRFNGVIALKIKPGAPVPQQIAANATNIGINELLSLQLKFFEDISGVHGAVQGRAGNSGESGALYAQQAQNATTSLLDLFDSFSGFVVDGAYKDLKNIQQFYDDKRFYNIAGVAGMVDDDPMKIRDVECDIAVSESTSTPVYRQYANNILTQFWSAGQITLEQLLEHGDFPFADSLLQSIKSQQEQMQQGGTPQGVDPELMQQVEENADTDNVAKAREMIQSRMPESA